MGGEQKPERPWGAPRRLVSLEQTRVIVFFALIGAIVLLLWELASLFPRHASDLDTVQFISLAAFAVLVMSALIFRRRAGFGEVSRSIAIWTAVAAVLVLGYAYQDELRSVYARVRSELVPSYPTVVSHHTMVLTASSDGGFFVMGTVNGLPVRFLVDTGASDIVLSPSDAKRLGVDLAELQFTRQYETANGAGRGAPYTIGRLTVGPVAMTVVPASINGAPMDTSLLGMAFLKRLDAFEVRGRKLYLRWRDK
jgi:aspartyl protease family protein